MLLRHMEMTISSAAALDIRTISRRRKFFASME
jgi:hypothetical protein